MRKLESSIKFDTERPAPGGGYYFIINNHLYTMSKREAYKLMDFLASKLKGYGIFAIRKGYVFEARNDVYETTYDFKCAFISWASAGFEVFHNCGMWAGLECMAQLELEYTPLEMGRLQKKVKLLKEDYPNATKRELFDKLMETTKYQPDDIAKAIGCELVGYSEAEKRGKAFRRMYRKAKENNNFVKIGAHPKMLIDIETN